MFRQFSNRVKTATPSQTLSISALATKLRNQGNKVINLAAGQADFDTPNYIKDAAIQAINNGHTKYTAVDGIPSLKESIINKLKNENALEYKPDQILVSCGAKHTLYNLFQSLINDDDEIIIPAPYWVSYPEMVKLAGGIPRIVTTTQEQGFILQAKDLNEAITAKTKLILLNSPNNPTGAVYKKAHLLALAEVLLQHPDILIASDDIYEHILFSNEPFHNIVNVCPQLHERTIVINGVSKSFAMTGWRIGYAAAAKEIIQAMKLIQSQSTSNPCSISQYAAEAALLSPREFIKQSATIFEKRAQISYEMLAAIDDVSCQASAGSFYIYPDFSKIIQSSSNINNDLELSEYLLSQYYVATVPGTVFGTPGYLRISFSIDEDSLFEGITRIGEAVSKLT